MSIVPGVNSTFGMEVSADDHPYALTVDSIKRPGLIDDWNRQHDEHLRVFVGDLISHVNGESGYAHHLAIHLRAMQRAPADGMSTPGGSPTGAVMMLQIEPQDPNSFVVELRVGPGCAPLGIAIGVDEDPHSVIIESIAPTGLIADWNRDADCGLRDADFAVHPGDRVTCINGRTLSGEQIIEFLSTLHALETDEIVQLMMQPAA